MGSAGLPEVAICIRDGHHLPSPFTFVEMSIVDETNNLMPVSGELSSPVSQNTTNPNFNVRAIHTPIQHRQIKSQRSFVSSRRLYLRSISPLND